MGKWSCQKVTGRRNVAGSRSTPLGVPNHSALDACKALPKHAFDKIQVVLKLGAGEVESKLPIHLRTVTSCVPDLLIFSDFEETAHGHHLIDALENFSEQYEHDNPDFKIYDSIKQQKASGQRVGKSGDGWKLDKYKFLPMMELTWKTPRQKDWYVFIELDTYVVWDNLLRFLSHLDPEQPLYMGSPVWPAKKPVFGHGGSGLILSRKALGELASYGRKFRDEYSVGNHQFGLDMKGECCGDEVLARVFKDIGITLKGYWPLINGEKVSTLRFGPEQWCEPIITLHHLSDKDVGDLWDWEMKRNSTTPLLFEELYGAIVEPSITPIAYNWTNMSEDDGVNPKPLFDKTLDQCKDACNTDRYCFQYVHHNTTCQLAHHFRLGHSQSPDRDTELTWDSGWNMARIDEFKKASSCGGTAQWSHSNP
ncbi:hypothetical protein BU16DRAFT_546567 [Lophium mytilinum]|uniref:N-acetylgalactosaminide beta-1,3-galactosyltransferase n=1 Tax=Lophium mytilinum TaxID=390894 RepID=A0A6A6RCS8_9PEZI|nr:hypothetical protein BU16DRAFT_546567 [Lophium mytilinum]